MKRPPVGPRTLLWTALAMALAACGPDANAPAQAPAAQVATTTAPLSEAAMVDELASQLQACSYDGKPVQASISNLAAGGADAGQAVVDRIMKYTGLPQNFDVIPHPQVPNAAALIVIGEDKLPHRVIAYNQAFMADVQKATDHNDWAPISIMAHEIGHHLSGHTIQPGGSQPPTELEADKFSGYVLYKMGAALADAQKAMNTLVPEADGPTHPGRSKRVAAIADGWEQACSQQSGSCSAEPAAVASTSAPVAEPVSTGTPAVVGTASTDAGSPEVAAATTARDVLPAPDAQAIPSKFGKFVVDETGLLDPATRAAFEQRMYALAEQHQVEIVTLVVNSLHGLSGDDYAYAMMRQLRVGKLDVGNGAVLVIAPKEGSVGVAMGPGIMLEMRDYVDLEKERLQSFIDLGVAYCKSVCNDTQTEMALAAAEHIGQDVSNWDFVIRYQSLGELMARVDETEKARMNGQEIEPELDPTWRKITRIEGTLVKRDAAASEQAKWVNDVHAESVGAPMYVRTEDGRHLLVYVNPHTEGLMSKPLQEGQRYVFIARSAALSGNPEDAQSFDLLSYDQKS
ncbi:MAG: TPM domain-containing protein [Lysobacterales bacterium]